MQFAELSDADLHYLSMPADDGVENPDSLVMVHGLASSMGFWYMGLAPMFSSSHRVTLYDLRGHGASSMTHQGYTPESLAEDLLRLLDFLEIESTHLLGHSYGGQVALHFAYRYPDRLKSLVLADVHLSEIKKRQRLGNWHLWPQIKQRFAEVDITLNEDDCEFGYRLLEEMARIHVEYPRRAKQLIGAFSPFSGRGGNRLARRWLELLDNETARQEIYSHDGIDREMLRAINIPTLALYGEHSQALVSGRVVARNIAALDFDIIPAAGHFFPVSKPALVADACYKFWSQRGMLVNVA